MNIEDIIRDPNCATAEEVVNGVNTDPTYKPIKGTEPVLTEYDVDTDMPLRFEDKLNLSENGLHKINEFLNRDSKKYSGEYMICPKCGKALDAVSNDGHFCKFCGTHLDVPLKYNFHSMLKKLREKEGKKQREIGDLLGFKSPYVCRLEKGERIPTVKDLKTLCLHFKCSVNVLFGQDAPRWPIEANTPPDMLTYQGNLPSFDAKECIKEQCASGYEEPDDEYIYKCPFCKEEVDLTPMEALTRGLASYEVMKMRSHGNDGSFCKHCGQGLVRPAEIDTDKAFSAYEYWIGFAKNRLKKK